MMRLFANFRIAKFKPSTVFECYLLRGLERADPFAHWALHERSVLWMMCKVVTYLADELEFSAERFVQETKALREVDALGKG